MMNKIFILLLIHLFFYISLYAQDLRRGDKLKIQRIIRDIVKYKENNQYEKIADGYYEIANLYYSNARYKEAEFYYNKSIKFTKDNYKIYKSYKTLAYIYHLTTRYHPKEIDYLVKTIQFADSTGIARNRFLHRIELCNIYFKNKEYDKVIGVGNKALEISFVTRTLEYSKEAIKLIKNSYEKKGNNLLRIRQYSEMDSLNDLNLINIKYNLIDNKDPRLDTLYSDFIIFKNELKNELKNNISSRKIAPLDSSITDIILNMSKTSAKVKIELDSLTTVIQRKEKRNEYLNKINKILGPTVVMTVIIFILLTISYRRYNIKKRQHKLLNQKNREIESQKRELFSKNKELFTKNRDLENAYEELTNTQNTLVEKAKMASLGQLVAGIGHELNSPLGAIEASIVTTIDFSSKSIVLLPKLVKAVTNEEFSLFIDLINLGVKSINRYNTKQKRSIKKQLKEQLQEYNIENNRLIANNLVDIGVYSIDKSYLPLYRSAHIELIMETTYNLVMQNKNGHNIKEAVNRASKIIFALRSYSYTGQSDEMVKSNIVINIETVLTIYHNRLKYGIKVERKFEKLPEINCYPDELSQVWINIIHNSIQAMNGEGKLVISAKYKDKAILISFTDNGKGIPENIKDRIFEPFFTTKPLGEGTGLGLDIIRKIIEKHMGTITFKSKEGVGTTFYVNLPVIN